MSSTHDRPGRDAATSAPRAWSILVIAIDALVIWALASPRRAWA